MNDYIMDLGLEIGLRIRLAVLNMNYLGSNKWKRVGKGKVVISRAPYFSFPPAAMPPLPTSSFLLLLLPDSPVPSLLLRSSATHTGTNAGLEPNPANQAPTSHPGSQKSAADGVKTGEEPAERRRFQCMQGEFEPLIHL